MHQGAAHVNHPTFEQSVKQHLHEGQGSSPAGNSADLDKLDAQ